MVERITGSQRIGGEWVSDERGLTFENVVPGVDLGLLLQRRAPRRLILPICPSFAWLSSDKLPFARGS